MMKLIENTPTALNNNTSKKQWTAPLVIFISNDTVRSGQGNALNEGTFFTLGRHHFVNTGMQQTEDAALMSYNS